MHANPLPTRFYVRPDGRRQLVALNLPASRDFGHRTVWRPLEAATMREHMAQRFATQYGTLMFAQWASKLITDGTFDPVDPIALAQMLSRTFASVWSHPEFLTVLAHDDFASMTMAAALQAPDEAIAADELISRSGVMFFATKQDLGQVDPVWQFSSRTRAVSWFVDDEMGSIVVALYDDGPDAEQTDLLAYDVNQHDDIVLLPHEHFQYLVPRWHSISPLRNGRFADKVSAEGHLHHDPALRLLRALTAIAASPRTAATTNNPAHGPSSRKKRSRRHAAPDTDITVLNLCNPEHGRYELEAATGRHLRQHWVRGHWRNQWYPGSQDHRIIWVDGFIRGDAALGTVTSPKVYVAR